MKIYVELSVRNFEFWSGGKDRASELTDIDWDIIEPNLEELFPDGCSDTELNDFFWFDFNTIAEWLGYRDEEDFCHKRSDDYVDPDERRESIIERVLDKCPGACDLDVEDKLDEFWDEDCDDDEAVKKIVEMIEEPIRRRAAIVNKFVSKFGEMSEEENISMNEYIDDNWDEEYPNDDMFVDELFEYMSNMRMETEEWQEKE